jgi:hypothetical protein
MHPYLGSILNVFNRYIINVTTTAINTCKKKILEFGQREVISFFTLVTNEGEHSIVYSVDINCTACI